MELFITIFVGLIAIINPFSVVPTWLTLTQEYTKEDRLHTLKKVIINAAVLFLGFVLLGKSILLFFGLSVTSIKLAGSLMIIMAALKLEVSKPIKGSKLAKKAEQNHREDISFSPMAMPLIIGPGTIAVIITFLEEYGNILVNIQTTLYILLSGVIILAICFFLLKYSDKIMNLLGYGGLSALSRLNGFILLCIGMQFFVSAIKDILIAA
jgi:multiple antibiotic resistance protein